jgi:hypothetical protein
LKIYLSISVASGRPTVKWFSPHSAKTVKWFSPHSAETGIACIRIRGHSARPCSARKHRPKYQPVHPSANPRAWWDRVFQFSNMFHVSALLSVGNIFHSSAHLSISIPRTSRRASPRARQVSEGVSDICLYVCLSVCLSTTHLTEGILQGAPGVSAAARVARMVQQH